MRHLGNGRVLFLDSLGISWSADLRHIYLLMARVQVPCGASWPRPVRHCECCVQQKPCHEAPRKFIRAVGCHTRGFIIARPCTLTQRGDTDESGRKTFRRKKLIPCGHEMDSTSQKWYTMGCPGLFSLAKTCNLTRRRRNVMNVTSPRPPLKLPVMEIRLFAALFWTPSRRTQGPLRRGPLKFQRRRQILILTGFFLPYLSTFLNRNANNGGLTSKPDANALPPAGRVSNVRNKIKPLFKPCIKRHPSVPALSHCMNLELPYAHFCYIWFLSPSDSLIMSMFPYL